MSTGTGRTLLGGISLAGVLTALALLAEHSTEIDWLVAYVHWLTATAPLGFWTVLLAVLIHVSVLVGLLFGLAAPVSLSCVLAILELMPCGIARRLAAEVRGDPQEPK